MKVKDVMTAKVDSCGPDDTLASAARIMWDHDCGFVPVAERETGRLVGVVTDRDICMAAYTKDRPVSEMPVYETMTRGVHVCHAEDGVDKAVAAMREHQVRRLPVVDDGERVVGVVSLNDLAVHAVETSDPKRRLTVAATLAAVSRHRKSAAVLTA